MKFLHTSDWHVGKQLKGRDRLDEQKAVLREIVEVARHHEVDAVLVSGDLYENAVPGASAQQLVVRTLMSLRDLGCEVIALAGNHDHPGSFDAYRPLMGRAGITLLGNIRPPGSGGVVKFKARSDGQDAAVALLPFLSQRYAVRAAHLMTQTPAESSGAYDQMVREILGALCGEFHDDTVNLAMAHLTMTNGAFGGGERMAQSIFEYSVPATVFPAECSYAALGHLHRRQTLPAACPVVYSGSPLAVDFGEQDNPSVVCIVEATASTPAKVTDVPITSARRLRTVNGTVAELEAMAGDLGDDYLRVLVREPARAGLREAVSDVLPNALEVRIDPEFTGSAERSARHRDRTTGSPQELFERYMEQSGAKDDAVSRLFAQLSDEVTASDAADGAELSA
ncbi:exonuclease SbcCD subunit D [Kineosporia sp. NBRC 101731]|uniref:exonuclease SbcCD subunit D n=1 Tax=Kineosporia sp. NBRC 101731 TaxID=3032199 RepID=UPI00249FAD64|nr:exonuclease SbcCD subunit D [Kineosporia sp. NBRC 101731]GLY31558.1 nuclease SbcCD subunit D [Kineosporia sp. NBRC 101731]